jgi:hypothetical protein
MSGSRGWESLRIDTADSLDRICVPGGWLYRTVIHHNYEGDVAVAVAMCFVPIPPGMARAGDD